MPIRQTPEEFFKSNGFTQPKNTPIVTQQRPTVVFVEGEPTTSNSNNNSIIVLGMIIMGVIGAGLIALALSKNK
ncbi:hypothetical protein LCGC14_2418980 [marine sediment metagenome]|uniref:Uncharacterized protein n=1 Tax=marine sediment metagenome TaxID=412755 RepID=A0A0F9EJK6_9ZZZZ